MLEIACILIGVFLAFTNVYMVKMLDSAMDYTNILDFIRLRRFKRKDKEYIEKAVKDSEGMSTHEKVNILNAAYLDILYRTGSKSLKSIICISCMNIRINLIIQILIAFAFVLQGASMLTALITIISSTGLNYMFYELYGQ